MDKEAGNTAAFRRSSLLIAGYTDSDIYARRRRGEIESIVPGAYLSAHAVAALEPWQRHRLRVLETASRMPTQQVFSHFAAAALHGIRVLREWPREIDVRQERRSGGRSGGLLRRHCIGLENVEIVEIDGVMATSPAQTVVDLARELRFADAVVAMDSALHSKRKPSILTTKVAIGERLDAFVGQRGHARAAAVADFATDLSDSPEESHSRVQLHLLGFPKPVLQHRVELPDGGNAYLDFYFPEYDHGGECDGRDKYKNPEFLRDRTPYEALMDEKDRENQVRRVIRRLSRWEPAELYPPTKLLKRLIRDGLPRTAAPRAPLFSGAWPSET